MAVAVAPLVEFNPDKGIIDGEAIHMSGRAIRTYSTSDKKRIVIKNSLFFRSSVPKLEQQYDPVFYLLDTILSKCSSKQCEVVFHKLLHQSEKEIAFRLGKYQSTISQHSTAAGWLSIELAVKNFEKTVGEWNWK